MGYIIRRRTKEDIKDIAHITTLGWNQNYKGIINKDFLDLLKENEFERTKHMLDTFDENDNHTFILDVDGKTVGFVKCVDSKINGYENMGEIQCLYIINGYKGYGYGKELLLAGVKELKAMGYNEMVIGCLEGNKSNYFYLHLNGKKVTTIKNDFGGELYTENVYLFNLNNM